MFLSILGASCLDLHILCLSTAGRLKRSPIILVLSLPLLSCHMLYFSPCLLVDSSEILLLTSITTVKNEKCTYEIQCQKIMGYILDLYDKSNIRVYKNDLLPKKQYFILQLCGISFIEKSCYQCVKLQKTVKQK